MNTPCLPSAAVIAVLQTEAQGEITEQTCVKRREEITALT